MLTKLKRITKERSLKQGIGNYQDKQTKKLISEVKNNLEAMESWLNETKEWISDLEDRILEITQLKQQTKRQRKKKEATFKIYGLI